MLNADRLRSRMKEQGLSQAELARRVGISQQSVARLSSGASIGSRHLHRIARELLTTPAYLVGEVDDPQEGAPLPPPVGPIVVTMGVVLPPERALARMFEGLLAGIDPKKPRDEQALLLAQRLPIGLSQLRDLLPDEVTPARMLAEAVAGDPMPEPQRPR